MDVEESEASTMLWKSLCKLKVEKMTEKGRLAAD